MALESRIYGEFAVKRFIQSTWSQKQICRAGQELSIDIKTYKIRT